MTEPAIRTVRSADDGSLPSAYAAIPGIARIIGQGKSEIANALMRHAEKLRDLFSVIATIATHDEEPEPDLHLRIANVAEVGSNAAEVLRDALDRFSIELAEEERSRD